MHLRRKFGVFLDISGADRWLVLEAMLLLGLARISVLAVPLRLMAPWLARAPITASCDEILLVRVRKTVTMAARNVPWNAVCLPQAIAAKAMLARRRQGSAFHLGAAFDDNGKLIAHAWLVSGGKVVVGEAGMTGMSPLARFG
jgi:hypothetical protein